MTDFFAALGLLLVIEGVVYGAFPDMVRRIGRMAETMPDGQLRAAGLSAAAIGLGIVWIVRH